MSEGLGITDQIYMYVYIYIEEMGGGVIEREGCCILRFGRKSEQTCIAFMLDTHYQYVCVLKSCTTAMNMYRVIYG